MVARIWLGAYFAAIAALLAALLHYHWQIIVTIVPLDLYESAMPIITGIIADGHNPYTRAFSAPVCRRLPAALYPRVAPLSWVFGNTFALHRMVSGFFLMLASVLCGYATWNRCRSFAQALATGVLMYAALLFYATPVSSTQCPRSCAVSGGTHSALVAPVQCREFAVWFAMWITGILYKTVFYVGHRHIMPLHVLVCVDEASHLVGGGICVRIIDKSHCRPQEQSILPG